MDKFKAMMGFGLESQMTPDSGWFNATEARLVLDCGEALEESKAV
jgi:hypothetical protein